LAKFGKIVLLRSDIRREGSELAQQHHSTVNELLRLTLLELAIIQAILAGKQPRCMSAPARPLRRERCVPPGGTARSARVHQ
jgi:hypothetical protein